MIDFEARVLIIGNSTSQKVRMRSNKQRDSLHTGVRRFKQKHQRRLWDNVNVIEKTGKFVFT